MSANPHLHLELVGPTGTVRLDPTVRHVLRGGAGGLVAGVDDAGASGTGVAAWCEYGVWTLAAASGRMTHAGQPVERLLVGGPVDLAIDGVAARVDLVSADVCAAPPAHAPQPDAVRPPLPTAGEGDWYAPDPPAEETRGPAPFPVTPPVPSDPVGGLAATPAPPEPVAAALTVRGLTVETHGTRRLDGVDLDLSAGQFLAVLGTSGAGKSTLLKALTAVEPATSGSIEFAGHDLYTDYDAVCRRVGYVPQDDILHTQLSVVETLRYAGRLRFPPDTPPAVIEARIDEVLHELGLVGRAEARIDQLSGGQRKRVNVAVELLTRPDLLILDEPTSGLDPGNERSLMELLRQLADAGRIVIVVTHSVESLHLCDSVLFLASGGVPVYLGAPAGLPPRFGAPDMTSVFVAVERLADPDRVRVPRAAAAPRPSRLTPPATSGRRLDNATVAEFGRQFHILTSRYVRVLASDRRNFLILALQAPILAALMLVVFGRGNFALPWLEVKPSKAAQALTGMTLGTIYLGASNAVREIVKERVIFRRELTFGISSTAYLASKVVVLGTFTVAQALLLTVTGTLLQDGPVDALLFGQPKFEVFAMLALAGVAAVGLGLAISAVSSTPDRAMTLLPVLLFAQLLLGGTIFGLGPFVNQVSWLMPSRWGIAGSGTTVDLHTLSACASPTKLDTCTSLWRHTPGNWLLAYAMLLGLTAAVVYGCWRLLERINPGRALQARVAQGAPAPAFAPPTVQPPA